VLGGVCSAVAALAAVVAGRRGLELRAGAVPPVVFIGVLIVVADMLSTTATTLGYLSIVAVLGYLSPAIVILWARVVLHERLRPLQHAAAVLVVVGVTCLALG
jgi:drug/metabolite transporter (DMT)-like permease